MDTNSDHSLKRKQLSVLDFFNKKTIKPNNDITCEPSQSQSPDSQELILSLNTTSTINTENEKEPIGPIAQQSEPEQHMPNEFLGNENVPTDNVSAVDLSNSIDIGYFINSDSGIDDHTKFGLLEHCWKPYKSFQYPFSCHSKQGRDERRYLRPNHFDQYPWLIYSESKSGLFCKYCTLFLVHNKGGKQKSEPLKKLVTTPLTKYAKLLGKDGDLEVHNNNLYHREAVTRATDFIKTYRSRDKQICNLINSERLRQVEENRKRLKPIVETIIFMGRQNIALRGHRDDGNLIATDSMSCVNEGNFREMLKYRIKSGDTVLENHLKNTSSRATYISHKTQNELIDLCSKEILGFILDDVKKSKYFSIIFDETTDISHISQMSLTIRNVNENNEVHERFIGFLNCHDHVYNHDQNKQSNADLDIHLLNENQMNQNDLPKSEPKLTGEILGNTVISVLLDMSMDLSNCVGIGTDGCAVMTSLVRGAVQQIQKTAKYAVHTPCANHALNLSISKSSNVQSVRNSVGIVQEILTFFNSSSKRSYILKNVLKGNKRTLSSLCETRWIERHDSFIQFQTCLPEIIEALTSISEWNDAVSSSKSKTLLAAICNCEFILTLYTLSMVLSVTLPASRALQGVNQDVVTATRCIEEHIIGVLKDKRKNCDVGFKNIFEDCKTIMEKLDIDIKLPRITKRQANRSNIPSSSPEEYFRLTLYIPLLENVLEDLRARFLDKKNKTVCLIIQLMPCYVVDIAEDVINEIIQVIKEYYSEFRELDTNSITLRGEIELWKSKWIKCKTEGLEVPKRALLALEECHSLLFPNIRQILIIVATLPVSVASAERSFSTLRRLKTWLRSQMGQNRLTGLALLHIHRDIPVSTDNVIDRFASVHKRNIDFIL
ncbi:unnamed protein product [Phaedon cochleariae]|uniref:TTF-type domain-containing protein n=1 Tax=Phaedon cochleariae TaxID=80249 RepID=A0A9P0DKI5_PHACE|nr:unnamed protein product [Phaedon cochleariae]